MLDIGRELKYPLYDERWLKKVIIGGVLNIIPVICFLSWGYAYRIFRRTLQGEEVLPLPAWDRWKEDFFKGVAIFALVLCWGIIPALFWKLHPGLGVLASAAGAVLFPMAFASYAREERFAEAFQAKLWNRICSTWAHYAAAWMACALLFVVVLFIWRLPVIGYPLGGFVFFYIFLVYARLFGLACREDNALRTLTQTAGGDQQDVSHSPS